MIDSIFFLGEGVQYFYIFSNEQTPRTRESTSTCVRVLPYFFCNIYICCTIYIYIVYIKRYFHVYVW